MQIAQRRVHPVVRQCAAQIVRRCADINQANQKLIQRHCDVPKNERDYERPGKWLNPAARRAFGEQLEAQSGEERRWLLSWTAPAESDRDEQRNRDAEICEWLGRLGTTTIGRCTRRFQQAAMPVPQAFQAQ